MSKSKIKIIALIGTAIIILVIGYSVFTKKVPFEKDNYIEEITDRIGSANDMSRDFLDNSSLNTEKALDTLPKIKKTLLEIVSDVNSSAESSSEEYSGSCAIIKSGLFENILVVDQLTGMLSNPTGNDVELAANNLKIFRDSADSYYSLISIDNKNFNLGTSMYTAINSAIDYCICSTNAKKLDDLQKAEESSFLNTFKELVFSLDNIMTDYYIRVLDCRNNKITYELLISDVGNCISKVGSIKDLAAGIRIPDKYLGIYNEFMDILNLYNDYLFNLKYALVTEKVRIKNAKINNDSIDSLYDSCNQSYGNLQAKYKKFLKEYNKLSSN